MTNKAALPRRDRSRPVPTAPPSPLGPIRRISKPGLFQQSPIAAKDFAAQSQPTWLAHRSMRRLVTGPGAPCAILVPSIEETGRMQMPVPGVEGLVRDQQIVAREVRLANRDAEFFRHVDDVGARDADQTVVIRRREDFAVSHEKAVVARSLGHETVDVEHDGPRARFLCLEFGLYVVHLVAHLGRAVRCTRAECGARR